MRKWKQKEGLHATYENLLRVCCAAGATDVADTICDVLRSRIKGMCEYRSLQYDFHDVCSQKKCVQVFHMPVQDQTHCQYRVMGPIPKVGF